jgi:putative glutamine amidotransferase
MSVPIIGLTASRRESPGGASLVTVAEAYTQALIQAGACPVVIPPGLADRALEALLARLDGLLFTGGGDIQPESYGAGPHPKIYEVDSQRDELELHLLGQAIDQGKPFLGICRGLQVVNVGLGGTLYTDIAEQNPAALKHDYYPDWPRHHLAHPVRLEPGSRLARILGGTEQLVNSLHHQAVRQLAPGLRALGYAPDGLVEACELPGHPFGLAVQWHPECLTEHAASRALFQALVEAAADKD